MANEFFLHAVAAAAVFAALLVYCAALGQGLQLENLEPCEVALPEMF